MDIKLPQKPPVPKSIPLTDMMESDVIPNKKENHAFETKSDETGSIECLWCEERFDSYKLARKHILLNYGQWEEAKFSLLSGFSSCTQPIFDSVVPLCHTYRFPSLMDQMILFMKTILFVVRLATLILPSPST